MQLMVGWSVRWKKMKIVMRCSGLEVLVGVQEPSIQMIKSMLELAWSSLRMTLISWLPSWLLLSPRQKQQPKINKQYVYIYIHYLFDELWYLYYYNKESFKGWILCIWSHYYGKLVVALEVLYVCWIIFWSITHYVILFKLKHHSFINYNYIFIHTNIISCLFF